MLKLLNACEKYGVATFARYKPYEYLSLRKVSLPLRRQGRVGMAVFPSQPRDARVLTGLRVKAAKPKSLFELFPKGADGLVFVSRSSG